MPLGRGQLGECFVQDGVEEIPYPGERHRALTFGG